MRVAFSFWRSVCLGTERTIGSRNPHHIDGDGAGFAFCWNGNTEILINYENSGNELLQLTSDTMLIVIPEFVIRIHLLALWLTFVLKAFLFETTTKSKLMSQMKVSQVKPGSATRKFARISPQEYDGELASL